MKKKLELEKLKNQEQAEEQAEALAQALEEAATSKTDLSSAVSEMRRRPLTSRQTRAS